MNQYILVGISLVVAYVFWTFIKKTGHKRISPAVAKNRLDTENGIILLDVRTKDEYLEKHIPKSILIPLDILAKEAIKKLQDKNAEIIVYCRSGSRSTMAVKELLELGYTHVSNMGGITGWPYETVSGNKK